MLKKIQTHFCTTLVSFVFMIMMLPAQATDSGDDAALKEIIEAVRNGWLQADGTPFREHFLDFEGARYIESGGQNNGLSDLIGHHVEPEADAFKDFTLNFSNIETHIEGEFAWAIANTEIKATLKHGGRVIDNTGYETFLFRKVGSEWKVVHTHSSSRPV